jgi:hypothetical protein
LGGGFIIATDGRSWYFTGTRSAGEGLVLPTRKQVAGVAAKLQDGPLMTFTAERDFYLANLKLGGATPLMQQQAAQFFESCDLRPRGRPHDSVLTRAAKAWAWWLIDRRLYFLQRAYMRLLQRRQRKRNRPPWSDGALLKAARGAALDRAAVETGMTVAALERYGDWRHRYLAPRWESRVIGGRK